MSFRRHVTGIILLATTVAVMVAGTATAAGAPADRVTVSAYTTGVGAAAREAGCPLARNAHASHLGRWRLRTFDQADVRNAGRAFGRPARIRAQGRYARRADWRGPRAMTVWYRTTPDPRIVSSAHRVLLTGSQWRTWAGLQRGHSLQELQERHPRARRMDSRRWSLAPACSWGAARLHSSITAHLDAGGRVRAIELVGLPARPH